MFSGVIATRIVWGATRSVLMMDRLRAAIHLGHRPQSGTEAVLPLHPAPTVRDGHPSLPARLPLSGRGERRGGHRRCISGRRRRERPRWSSPSRRCERGRPSCGRSGLASCVGSCMRATRFPTRVDRANSVASEAPAADGVTGLFVSGVSMLNSRTETGPRCHRRCRRCRRRQHAARARLSRRDRRPPRASTRTGPPTPQPARRTQQRRGLPFATESTHRRVVLSYALR
jgi:hypothetical protein